MQLSEHQKKILLILCRRGQHGIQFAGDGGIGKTNTANSLVRRDLAFKHGARHYITKAGELFASENYPNEKRDSVS